MAGLIDENRQGMVMMAKGLSLESIGVQPLSPPGISTGQKHDADDWALTGTSFCCMDQHPPLLRPRHYCTAAHGESQSVKPR